VAAGPADQWAAGRDRDPDGEGGGPV